MEEEGVVFRLSWLRLKYSSLTRNTKLNKCKILISFLIWTSRDECPGVLIVFNVLASLRPWYILFSANKTSDWKFWLNRWGFRRKNEWWLAISTSSPCQCWPSRPGLPLQIICYPNSSRFHICTYIANFLKECNDPPCPGMEPGIPACKAATVSAPQGRTNNICTYIAI